MRRRVAPELARNHSVIGFPSTKSGAAAIMTMRCWDMWAQKKVCDHAASGPRYAMANNARPARKHQVKRDGHAAPDVRQTRTPQR